MDNRLKISIITACLGLFSLLCFTSCSSEEAYDKEMYHPVLYMLSSDSYNVYNVVYPFKDTTAIGYFSIGCGGSKPNAEEVTIEIEPDTVLYNKFNRLNFVLDVSSYAKILPKERYEISSYSVKFPAHSPEQYIKVAVKVNQKGLSPDSIYFIPLSIKSVSKYEVNPEKKNMLFRVLVQNDYAEQINTTVYYQRGTIATGTTTTPVNGSKILQPLSKNEVRMFAGTKIQSKQSTLADINQWSIVARINADETASVRSYGTIEVEQLQQVNYNRHYTQKDLQGKDVDYIDLYYRYRTLTSTNPATYSAWTEVKESLQRIN